MKILVLNGPNLNTLGVREPAIYGTTTLVEIIDRLRAAAGPAHAIADLQSNHEGTLIDFLQRHPDADGAIINPGGLAHTSVVLRDAVAGCAFPVNADARWTDVPGFAVLTATASWHRWPARRVRRAWTAAASICARPRVNGTLTSAASTGRSRR